MNKTLQVALVISLFAITDARRAVMAADPTTGCAQFVQKFYDWYVAREKKLRNTSHKDVMEVAMKEKRSAFTPELIKALQEDVAAARKNPGEIVGLDFDPILASQEEPEKYEVGQVRAKGDHYLVDLFGYLEGKKDAKPTVVAELVSKNGQWIFTNFHYEGDTSNLVDVLKQLKKDRGETK
jgi:Protein of unknown function (DUF3828)